MDPILYFGLAFVAAFLIMTALRSVRAKRARRRVVEPPNSHYTPALVEENQARSRWHEIDLDRIHEINREEVVRLLATVEAGSAGSLKPAEREFLDHMTRIAGPPPSPPERRERGRPVPSSRLSPAEG